MNAMAPMLDSARGAAARYAWREAHEAYSQAAAEELTGSDLERFAEAAWWTGRREEAIGLRQRAFTAYSSEGDTLSAARIAVTLFWDHMANAAFAVARGWFAKAERSLEGVPESPVHGYLIASRAFGTYFAEGAYDEALEAFEEAFGLSQRFGDPELEAMTLVGKGKVLVETGHVE